MQKLRHQGLAHRAGTPVESKRSILSRFRGAALAGAAPAAAKAAHEIPVAKKIRAVKTIKVQIPKYFLVSRSVFRRYYYCKSVRGKWHRVERVLRGMRWNAYLYYGLATPLFKPLETPKLPAVVSGLMCAMKTTNELLHKVKTEHVMQAKDHHRHLDKEHTADIIPISLHPSFHYGATETQEHRERHSSGHLYYSVHHKHHKAAANDMKHEANHPSRMQEKQHDSTVTMVTMSSQMQMFAPREEHHMPLDDVKVHYSGYHHGHRSHHHHVERPHVSVHHHHSHRKGPTEHETYYFYFQQPWTAILMGMPGNRKCSVSGARCSALKSNRTLGAWKRNDISMVSGPQVRQNTGRLEKHRLSHGSQFSVLSQTETGLPWSGNTILRAQFPRKRFKQLKVTVADASPPK